MTEVIAGIVKLADRLFAVQVRGDDWPIWTGRSMPKAVALCDLLNRGEIDAAHTLANDHSPTDAIRGG